jgi:hypothetical protein
MGQVSTIKGKDRSSAISMRESGLRENCMIRLFERTEEGRKADLFRLYSSGYQERRPERGNERGIQ